MRGSQISLYNPKHQLVFFESDGNGTPYVEYYEVLDVDGKKILSAGKPVTKTLLKNLVKFIEKKDTKSINNNNKLMPLNVLYFNQSKSDTKLIWYNPQQVRTIEGIYKRPIKIQLPAVVYLLNNNQLYIYATKTINRRPDLTTQLFELPLPNIYKEGNVCMGNVKTPKNFSEISDLIAAWEFAFWGSKFTNHLFDDTIMGKLKSYIKAKKPFPNKELTPYKSTLVKLIK